MLHCTDSNIVATVLYTACNVANGYEYITGTAHTPVAIAISILSVLQAYSYTIV